jgi:hypothetical protein
VLGVSLEQLRFVGKVDGEKAPCRLIPQALPKDQRRDDYGRKLQIIKILNGWDVAFYIKNTDVVLLGVVGCYDFNSTLPDPQDTQKHRQHN